MSATHTMPEPTSVWAAPEGDAFTHPLPDPEREQRMQAEIQGILNSLGITWPVEPVPEPVSPHCPQRIPRVLGGVKVTYRCTRAAGHDGQHEACDTAGTVVAHMAVRVRKPSPRKRTA